MFAETWRLFRDYFYVPNMHGYDWEELRAWYGALLPHVAHRSDLNYVISEMIGELNAGHTYVSGGDFEIPDRPVVGLPGARFELDAASNRYRIASVFAGHNEEPKYRSPLTEVGSVVRPGSYVLAIDGEELVGGDNPYRLLQNLTGAVTLTVNDAPLFEGAREVEYRPVASEADLVYLGWVTENHARVTELSDGRVGYLHIPNMGAEASPRPSAVPPPDPQGGLIVDVRSNGGGNVSSMTRTPGRTLLGTRFGRTTEPPSTYPGRPSTGTWPAYLRDLRLRRRHLPQLLPGGGPRSPHRQHQGVVGGNIGLCMGRGSSPDRPRTTRTVRHHRGHRRPAGHRRRERPRSVIAGRDPQLERGVAEVLEAIRRAPKSSRPARPIR